MFWDLSGDREREIARRGDEESVVSDGLPSESNMYARNCRVCEIYSLASFLDSPSGWEGSDVDADEEGFTRGWAVLEPALPQYALPPVFSLY